MWFVYILLCEDGTLYTGISNNVEKRFADHKTGRGARYTKSHKPVKIIYCQKAISRSEALKREQEIKEYTREQKIKFLNLDLTT